MEKIVLHVEGMSCAHCVRAITNAVGALPGVAHVLADLDGKTATVEYNPAECTLDRIQAEIEDQGYKIVK